MRKELWIAGVMYFITMITLFIAIYRFMQNWHFDEQSFFVAGILLILAALGWGYVLTSLIFAPKKQMEETLTTLTNDIIHELNIPLSTIQANTTMLKKTTKDANDIKRLKRIEDASFRLERLYLELVYSIKKEMYEIEKEVFEITEVIKERVAIFEEQQRNPFVLEVDTYEVRADKIGFEQMLDNILANAMKYSDKTSPIVLSLSQDSLSIQDKGQGMTTAELLRVHERYFQGDEGKEGDGIGLTLVKAYCDTQNIMIRIQSEKNEGTTVHLGLEKVKV